MKRANVGHAELGAERRDDVGKERVGRSCENDVVNVQKQISSVRGGVEDEERGVRAGRNEADALDERSKTLKPSPQRLFEAI